MKVEFVKKGDKRTLPWTKKKGVSDGWGQQEVEEDSLLVSLDIYDGQAAFLSKSLLRSLGFYYKKPKEVIVEEPKKPIRNRGKSSSSARKS